MGKILGSEQENEQKKNLRNLRIFVAAEKFLECIKGTKNIDTFYFFQENVGKVEYLFREFVPASVKDMALKRNHLKGCSITIFTGICFIYRAGVIF